MNKPLKMLLVEAGQHCIYYLIRVYNITLFGCSKSTKNIYSKKKFVYITTLIISANYIHIFELPKY